MNIDLEKIVKTYDKQFCIEMIWSISSDIDNLISGQNASLSMVRIGKSEETYQDVIERTLKSTNEMLKLVIIQLESLIKDEQRK